MDYALPRAIDFPRFELTSAGHTDARQPAGRQRRRRSRHARLDAEHRRRGRRRAQRVRRQTYRHDASPGKAVAHHPGRPIVISTAFEYSRATSVDDALAKLRAANGEGKAHRGRPQPDPGHEASPQPARGAHRHRPHSRALRHPQERRQIEIGAGTVHHDVATSALLQQDCPMMAETAALDWRPAGPQSRHARRQHRACRSVGRLPRRDAGARRRHSHQGAEWFAHREGARFLSRAVHGRPGRQTRSSSPCSSRR